MKKFCSTCGNQLELSQRFCGECGAVNPFFVPAFTLLSDQSQSLEKLRIEKERIEMELAKKENAQKEFQRQELLRKEIEELDKLKAERIEKERLLRESLEREKAQANLKMEILQVKEEAEQYKKETIDLVREVRKEVKEEIQQIEEENKRLKQEVDLLNKHLPDKNEGITAIASRADVLIEEALPEQPVPTADEPEIPRRSNPVLKIVLALAVFMGAFLVYFYVTNIHLAQTASTGEPVKKEIVAAPPVNTAAKQVVDTMLASDIPVAKEETPVITTTKVSNAVLTSPAKPVEIKKAVAVSPAVEKPTSKREITEAKVMNDLNGKKISGCGVIIGNDVELKSVANLVMVEKAASYTKYKCSIKLVQGSDTYTAVPYLYYTEDGAIIKVDGTNCE